MTLAAKNVHIDTLNNIVNKTNNTYHYTIKYCTKNEVPH